MLQNIRDHITGWVAGIVIVLISVAFVFWGLEYYLEQMGSKGDALAKVNGHEISQQAVNALFQNLQRTQVEKNGGKPLDDQTTQALKQYALQQIITQTALLNAAEKQGFNASNDQVKQVILSEPAFQENGQFSPQKFQQVLYANSSSPQQFVNQMRELLIVNQVSAGLQASAFVLPNELKKAYLLLKEGRTFGYFIIPAKKFFNSVVISDSEIKNYFQQNIDNFKIPEKVQVSYLILSPNEIEKKIVIKPEEIRQYYESNQQNYTVPKKWNLSQILVPLSENPSEQEINRAKNLALQLSKNTRHLKRTAKTYWMAQDQISGPMLNILNNLKLNEYSAPFRTSEGMVIIKINKIEQPKTKSFEQVKIEIQKLLAHQKAQQIFSEKSDQLSNLTYTNPNSLDAPAKSLNLPIQKSALITKFGEKIGLFSDQKVLSVVFSDDVLAQNNNSQPIELKDGSLIVLRVNQKIPSKNQNLSSVREKIKQILSTQIAQQKAGLKAYEIQKALENENPLKIAKLNRLSWVVKTNVNRDTKNIDPDILNKAFALSKDSNIVSIQLDNGDYAVIKLINTSLPNYKNISGNEQKILAQNLANFLGEVDYRNYVASVLKKAKIKIYSK